MAEELLEKLKKESAKPVDVGAAERRKSEVMPCAQGGPQH